jgi:arylsulfatase A-like enzyme
MRPLRSILLLAALAPLFAADKPNVIVIMADDLGYGDISANGATALKTPNIDRLAAEGLRFTSGYCSASTCTPTRYSFLTGNYAFRHKGTGIAPPNGHLIYRQDYPTHNAASLHIFDYIESFYNRARIHSSLNHLSPVDFESLNN